jgi:hypothetical protein
MQFDLRPNDHRFGQLAFSADGALSGGRPSTDSKLQAMQTVAMLKDILAESGARMFSPDGFFSLPDLFASQTCADVEQAVSRLVKVLHASRAANLPSQLDVTAPDSVHCKNLYMGMDYSSMGPVIVHAGNLANMFPGFVKPSAEEVADRVAIGKATYGTMPGVEAAYSGAIVKAMQPRTIFIIGEHKGVLTDYIARCAPSDCIIFTMDLPKSMSDIEGVKAANAINQSYINYSQDEIGQVWRTSDEPHTKNIIGFAGDSTHGHSAPLFESLRSLCDLVIVDGNHSFTAVDNDLVTASNLLTPGGVILLDDFWKPARLYEVTEAALHARRYDETLSHLYHLSWGFGDDAVQSNLAFFVGNRW